MDAVLLWWVQADVDAAIEQLKQLKLKAEELQKVCGIQRAVTLPHGARTLQFSALNLLS